MHSPTYKHGKYTKDMQIKHLIAYKSIEIALKYTIHSFGEGTPHLPIFGKLPCPGSAPGWSLLKVLYTGV